MSNIFEKYETTKKFMPTKHGAMELPTNGNGLSRKEKSFLDLAMKISETSEVENRHGAVVVKNGRVLSLGINKWRNKGLLLQDTYNPILTTHAEIDALSRVQDPAGAILYIARSGKGGKAMFSRPCKNCMEAIETAQIKRIIYSVSI